ncbi:MAG: DUF2997 domain-containing protein [Phycisphaerae bacterium]|nr:DUF2997 domain-containing protein [Phycisphaerae bacterium]
MSNQAAETRSHHTTRGKHIRVTIAPDGTCTVDAINFTGPACQLATGEITAALGGQISRQHDKPEARLR